MKVVLKQARGAFLKLTKPEQVKGQGKPKFGGAFILEADSPFYQENLDKMNAAIVAVANEKWGKKGAEMLASLKAKDKVALHDGDTKAELDGYAGNWFVNASAEATKPPTLVDQYRQPVSRQVDEDGASQADRLFYSGCYVNVIVTVWAQDNDFGKRINASLSGVQFAAHGTPFGGSAPASADEFEMLETMPDDFTDGSGLE